jgi:hypothetical protein
VDERRLRGNESQWCPPKVVFDGFSDEGASDQQQCSDGAQRRDAVECERALRHNGHAEEQRRDRREQPARAGDCPRFG